MAIRTKILLWLVATLLAAPSQAATLYLSSVDGSDADNGTTWALAKATLVGSFAAVAAGDIIYVDPAHAETQAASMTLTSPGTSTAPVTIYCAGDRATAPPSTITNVPTASVSVTGASAISFFGFAYCTGLIFNSGSGSAGSTPNFNWTDTTPWWWKYENGSIRILGTGTTSAMNMGGAATTIDDNLVEFVNTTVVFGNVGQAIKPRCRFGWTKTPSAVGGTIPTTLFVNPGGNGADVRIRGVDFSAVGAGKNLISVATAQSSRYYFERCNLGASVTFVTGTFAGQGGTVLTMWDCDSADTNYKYHRQNFAGTTTGSIAVYRNGGASDGQVPVGRVMTSSANTKLYSGLEFGPITVFNTATNSQTLTVHVATDNITLNNADAHIRVEEPGTSGLPLSVFVTSKVADHLTSTSNYPTDAVSTWTGVPGTPVKQDIAVTYTPNKRGAIQVYVVLNRPSTVLYVDPTSNIQ